MSKILIIGDLHLGKGLSIGKPGIGTSLNSRIQDQFKLLEWISEVISENHVHTVIFTGDICEEASPDYVLLIKFIEWLKLLEVHNVKTHIVIGNHDIKRSGQHYISALDLIEAAEISNCTLYKYVDTIYVDSVGFTFLPYRDRRSFNLTNSESIDRISSLLHYELRSIPAGYDKVLIGHLAIDGALFVGDEIDDEANELLVPAEVFAGYDHVWMGHVHKPQVLRKSNPYVAHVGSLDISDFGECDHTKVVILYDASSESKFTEISVPSRPLRNLKISVPSGVETTSFVLDEVNKQNMENAIVRLEVKLKDVDSPNCNRPEIEDQIYKQGAFHICGFTESRARIVVPQEKRTEINNTIQPKTAAAMFADQMNYDGEEKSLFLNMCFEVISETHGE